MALTDITSSTVPIEISLDSGSSWKTLVCLENYTHALDSEETTVETFCGPITSTPDPIASIDFTAVCNSTPDGGTEVTYSDLLSNVIAKTSVMYRLMSGTTGSTFYHSGTVKITNLTLEANAPGEPIRFSGTLVSSGLIDIVP